MSKKIIVYQGQAPSGATAVYTASVDTTLDAVTVCNTSASGVALSVWLAPTGAASGNANKVYDAYTIGPNSQMSLALLVNHAIPKDGKLYLMAATASALTVTVSGRG